MFYNKKNNTVVLLNFVRIYKKGQRSEKTQTQGTRKKTGLFRKKKLISKLKEGSNEKKCKNQENTKTEEDTDKHRTKEKETDKLTKGETALYTHTKESKQTQHRCNSLVIKKAKQVPKT